MKTSHRIWGLIAIVVSTAIVIYVSLAYDWFPTLISPRDGKIDTVYEALLVASIPFFMIIMAGLIFMIIEFRAKGEDDDRDGEPIHGSTKLEIVWTVIPTLVVIGLGIYAWWVLDYTEAKQKNELSVNVYAQQFAWSFEYPKSSVHTPKPIKSGILVVPQNRPLVMNITSRDVVHSFFVPNARVKKDATAGFVKSVRFSSTKLGDFPIVCAELCGVGHATMRSTLRVVKPAVFNAWVKNGGKFGPATTSAGSGAGTAAGGNLKTDGTNLFNSNGCNSCHTLAAANASGKAGPDLNGIGAKGAAFLKASIVDPNKDIAKGFSANIMPANFGTSLSKQDLNTLVQFLVKYSQQ